MNMSRYEVWAESIEGETHLIDMTDVSEDARVCALMAARGGNWDSVFVWDTHTSKYGSRVWSWSAEEGYMQNDLPLLVEEEV